MATAPCLELRYGLIKVRVWRRHSKRGPRYRIAISRLFRNGDAWQESSRFGRDDLPVMKLALAKAHEWIFRQSAD